MNVRNVRIIANSLCTLALLAAAGVSGAEAQTKAYVVHTSANLLSVIDTATGTVAGTIPVGAGPTKLAVARDGGRAYVINRDSASVSLIDTASDAVVATIPVGGTPAGVAVTPDGRSLYVTTTVGVVAVIDTAAQTVVETISVGSGGGDIAITPDGSRAYVTDGLIYVIDTVNNVVVKSFPAEAVSIPGQQTTALTVTIAPDGTRAYVGTFFLNGTGGFSAGGSVILVDTASESVAGEISLGSVPGSLALTPDGSRLYVGIQSTFVNTGYGMGFFPGSHVVVIDTITDSVAWTAIIDLGRDGPNWTQQNTAAGIGVTADRRFVYIAVPRLSRVAVADVNTNAVTALIPVVSGPAHLAVVPEDVPPVPYLIDAADDSATMTTSGGTAVGNVLANDRIGGMGATFAHVTLTQQSSTAVGVTLDQARAE